MSQGSRPAEGQVKAPGQGTGGGWRVAMHFGVTITFEVLKSALISPLEEIP